MMEPPLLLMAPWHHALRGVSATLAAGAAFSTLTCNRRAPFSLKPDQLATLRLVGPSRNAVAIAVFVGVFRFVERFERIRSHRNCKKMGEETDESVQKGLILASVLGVLSLKPSSRTPLVALLSTHAVSTWFQGFIAKHPELAALKPLDLVVFLASGGWIMYSSLFHPESYEPSHMKLIMKYSLTSQEAATYLQERYAQGLNPNTCDARHAGQDCTSFLLKTFVWQTISMGLRIYTPVHLTTWLLALRHRAVRGKPFLMHLRQLATRVIRSALYYIVYILVGWTVPCYTKSLGERSLAWRKGQFLVCGSLPALSILFEMPSRRRAIGVILSSYAFVSMGTVLSRQKRFEWLQQGSGPVRSSLDVLAITAAVAYTMESLVEDSVALQRMLFGHQVERLNKRQHAEEHDANEQEQP